MSIVVPAGQLGERPQFEGVLSHIPDPHPLPGTSRTPARRVHADQAYASRRDRAHLRRHGIRCTPPDKAAPARDRDKRGCRGGRPPKFAPVGHLERHAVECGINRFTRQQAVARYDKLAVRYETTFLVAAGNEWP